VPDLPAHGARFKEQPLTLGNAVSTLYEVIRQEAPDKRVSCRSLVCQILYSISCSQWLQLMCIESALAACCVHHAVVCWLGWGLRDLSSVCALQVVMMGFSMRGYVALHGSLRSC
jgi:hypothetical protein